MTVTQRVRQPDELLAITEPGTKITCDCCEVDLTHSVLLRCADATCEDGEGVDICPTCFCEGKEFAAHKRWHDYRVIEPASYPVFTEDWGADEELLLLEGLALQGFGNWQAIAEHIGTRTKEDVAKHYQTVFIDSPHWPLPDLKRKFDIEPAEFHARKRRRLAATETAKLPTAVEAPQSTPAITDVAGWLPGRLEYEHELEHEAEDAIKDLVFGTCHQYGGNDIPEDDTDPDLRARQRWIEDHTLGADGLPLSSSMHFGMGSKGPAGKGSKGPSSNGGMMNGSRRKRNKSEDDSNSAGDDDKEDEQQEDETEPMPVETEQSLEFKLMLIESYSQRLERRTEGKQLMFNRGLTEFKKISTNDKKRSKEEKEMLTRWRPFAKLQTNEDFEEFMADLFYEQMLRTQIAKLQEFRRIGLRTQGDIDVYQIDLTKRSEAKIKYPGYQAIDRRISRGSVGPYPDDGRGSREPDGKLSSASAGPVRKGPAPLNLANSPSLHLLTPAEQTLCSQLRILPKPYLVIKETLVREYARRGGKLRRREARELVKIDVNKTSRVWDFLVQAGYLRIPDAPSTSTQAATENGSTGPGPSGGLSPPKESGSAHPSQLPQISVTAPTSVEGVTSITTVMPSASAEI